MSKDKKRQFVYLYDKNHDAFIRYCSALAYGYLDTQDLVQDVLLTAYKHYDKISHPSKFLPYLIRTARNKAISQWRKSKFSAELTSLHAERMRAKNVVPEVLVDIGLLYKAIQNLPTQQAEAIVLFEISGFSMKEIAEIQAKKVGAVKTMISRARKSLKEMMKEDKAKSNSINRNSTNG